MLDLGTLQAHIKLDGADKFNADLSKAAGATEAAGAAGLEGAVSMEALGAAAASAAASIGAAVAVIGVGFLKVTKDVVTASVQAYAEMEQLEGGVSKLFGDAAETVKSNAQQAFSTMGISANEYMSTVTGFSASLISSLGGDTQAAAEAANSALEDMADNASVFGTDMESIQNAYQGFAKQQYTMLDNLRLGYGGTQKEMQRLLDDAGKLTGQRYDISNLNDVYSAIHAIQVQQGIAGNAANEASHTISGSFNATKAAWENLLAGLGDPSKDVDKMVDNVFDSLGNLLDNVGPLIEKILNGMERVMPKIAERIGPLVERLGPYIETALQALGSMAMAAVQNLLMPLLEQIWPLLAAGVAIGIGLLVAPIPTLLASAVALIINGLLVFLDEHGKQILDWFQAIPQNILNAIGPVASFLVGKGRDFLNGLWNGAKNVFESVKNFFRNIPSNVLNALGSVGSTLRSKGQDFINGLKGGIEGAIGGVIGVVSGIPGRIVGAIGNVGSLLWDAGSSIVGGLVDGLNSRIGSVVSKAQELGALIKNNKGPEEYDKRMLIENGQWIMDGLINGIDSMVPDLVNQMRGVSSLIAGTSFTQPTVGGYGYGARGATFNVYINGTKINSDSAIESKFMDLMTAMARKGMM